jgi:hypothetical protein
VMLKGMILPPLLVLALLYLTANMAGAVIN